MLLGGIAGALALFFLYYVGVFLLGLVAVPPCDAFFKERDRTLYDAIHGPGTHAILHTGGRINDPIPAFIDMPRLWRS